MKQFKKTTSSKNINPQTLSQIPSKNNILKEIDKLKKQIEGANEDIEKTSKLLDVDLFLQQQKQKRLEYAKQLNTDFETQKKIREEKLYKKFKREEKEENKEEEQRVDFRIQNVVSIDPMVIIKSLANQSIDREWVKNGHHYKPKDIETDGLREKEETIFKDLYLDKNEKTNYDGDSDAKHIVWKNVKKIVENPLEIVTLPKVIPENSLIPNDGQSENIISSLCFMTEKICNKTFAEDDQIILSEFFTPNGEVTVIIDKEVLVREFAHKDVNLGSRCQNTNIIWPTLIEKSFKKLQIAKNLSNISNSLNKSLYTIFGLDPEFIFISNKNVIKENFPLVLGHLLQEGKVGFLNLNGHSKKSYGNRVYMLEEVKEEVLSRGEKEKKEIKYKIQNHWRGKLINNENVNRFNLLQILELFNCLVVLRDYPKKWTCSRISSSYYSNGAVGAIGNEWTKNPQYLFTLTKPTNIRIILRKSTDSSLTQKEGVYGFLLFHNKEMVTKLEAMKMDWLITKTKSTDLQEASYCNELAKGHYILIPYTTEQSDISYQFYTIDFFVENESSLDFGKGRLFDYNYEVQKGSRLNSDKEKVVQTLQNTERYEKPKTNKIDIVHQFTNKITDEILSSLKLNLFKDVQLKHFFIPGMISNLLINKSIQVDTIISKDKQKEQSIIQNEELCQEEKAENLSILLGYDAMCDEVNQGLMKDYIEQSVGIFDFRNYELQEEGLTAILEALSESPQIIELDLSGNSLNDMAITYLCYYMEKGDRVELKSINVQNNSFGKVGQRALQGLRSTFPKLVIEGI